MATDVTREEFTQIKTRVDIVEREVEGEKMVTRYILEQSRRNGDDLATVKTRLDRIEGRVDEVDQDVKGLRAEFGGLGGEFVALRGEFVVLRESLPKIVADVMREVLRERDAGN
jgi:hypothetical protein